MAAAPESIDYMPTVPGDPTARRVDVKVDPDRQEIAFKLTYTSAIVGAFALIVVLSLAYVIGRRMNQGPAGAMAATMSTNDLRKGPTQPGVMDLAKAARDGVPTSIAPDGGDESANVIDPTPNTPKTSTTAPPLAKPAAPVEEPFNGKRIINKNYMVMQSFPESEKALAEEAVKRLNQARIGTTLEHGLRGWPSTWYNVVGTMPFEAHGKQPGVRRLPPVGHERQRQVCRQEPVQEVRADDEEVDGEQLAPASPPRRLPRHPSVRRVPDFDRRAALPAIGPSPATPAARVT